MAVTCFEMLGREDRRGQSTGDGGSSGIVVQVEWPRCGMCTVLLEKVAAIISGDHNDTFHGGSDTDCGDSDTTGCNSDTDGGNSDTGGGPVTRAVRGSHSDIDGCDSDIR
ncbi:unnamed protein product [Cuscuta europaea]|uniref:Uncharacterized protein n=1 Tax=Cuscuta europaea TaxID=41803 RepID=A0A9P0Z180_CUSEU|nr:unnamed protein product [Cuscuta europaea]